MEWGELPKRDKDALCTLHSELRTFIYGRKI